MLLLVNGASSSGKTSTAAALAARLEAVHFDIDTFEAHHHPEPETWPEPFNLRQAHYLCAARREVQCGRTVVLEYIFRSQAQRDAAGEWFAGLPAVWVHLFCPLEELVRRERDRGDRRPGLAEEQFPQVESVGGWDLVVDTTLFPQAADRADRILQWLAR